MIRSGPSKNISFHLHLNSTCRSISLYPIACGFLTAADSRRRGRKAVWVLSWQFCPTCLHPHLEARSLEMKCYVKRKNKNQKQRRHIFFLNRSIQDFILSLRKCCRVNPKALESRPESWMGVAKGWDMASGPLGFHSDAKFPEGRQHKGIQAQHSLPHNRCMFLELNCIGPATPWALGQITAFWASGSSSVGVGSGEQVIVSCFFCVRMSVFSPFS